MIIHRFQWVVLSLDHICNLDTERQIRNALGQLPTGLDNAYNIVWSSISKNANNYQLALKVMKWIMATFQPVTPEDLLKILLWTRVEDPDLTVELLLAVCHNLVVIDREENILRFSHLSVREYLIKYQFTVVAAHSSIASICLEIWDRPLDSMLYEVYRESSLVVVTSEDSTNQLIKLIPWRQDAISIPAYCISSWPYHVQLCDGNSGKENDLSKSLHKFFGTKSAPSERFQEWCKNLDGNILRLYIKHVYTHDGEWEPTYGPSGMKVHDNLGDVVGHMRALQNPVALLACFNFDMVPREFWDQAWPVLELNTDTIMDLMYIASTFGHAWIVEKLRSELLRRGKICQISIAKPIASACLGGHENVVRILLATGIDINYCNDESSFLTYAVASGSVELVQMLLERGARVNADAVAPLGTPLNSAIWDGRRDIMQMLLDCGADVNLVDHHKRSPLSSAAVRGYQDIVQLLLDNYEVDINQSSPTCTSLCAAAIGGNMAILRTLIEHGAEVNQAAGIYGTALNAAALGEFGENPAVVQLLLDFGADVNQGDEYYGSVLNSALAGSCAKIVTILKRHGAKLSPLGKGRFTERAFDNIHLYDTTGCDTTGYDFAEEWYKDQIFKMKTSSNTNAKSDNIDDSKGLKNDDHHFTKPRLFYKLGEVQLRKKSYDAAQESFLVLRKLEPTGTSCRLCEFPTGTIWIKCARCTRIDFCGHCFSSNKEHKRMLAHKNHQFVMIDKDGKVLRVSYDDILDT